MSKKILNTHEISLLSNGLKFVPTPKGPDLMTLEKDIKNFVRLLKLKEHFHNYNQNENDDSILKPNSDFTPSQVKNPVLLSVCDSLNNMAENLPNLVTQNHYNNLSPDEQKALKNLKNDNSIIIKEADKGSMVVILDKTFYQKQISIFSKM